MVLKGNQKDKRSHFGGGALKQDTPMCRHYMVSFSYGLQRSTNCWYVHVCVYKCCISELCKEAWQPKSPARQPLIKNQTVSSFRDPQNGWWLFRFPFITTNKGHPQQRPRHAHIAFTVFFAEASPRVCNARSCNEQSLACPRALTLPQLTFQHAQQGYMSFLPCSFKGGGSNFYLFKKL